MIDYDNDFESMEINCDHCSDADSVEGTFLDCIDQLKEKGWVTKQIDGGLYDHTCPACAEKDPAADMEDTI